MRFLRPRSRWCFNLGVVAKSTLKRLELGEQAPKGKYHKTQADAEEIRDLLVTMQRPAVLGAWIGLSLVEDRERKYVFARVFGAEELTAGVV